MLGRVLLHNVYNFIDTLFLPFLDDVDNVGIFQAVEPRGLHGPDFQPQFQPTP